MELLVIGIIVGVILGLTGSGGALIALPLFMQLLQVPLKTATLWSLAVVVLASLLNLFGKVNKISWQHTAWLFLASTVGSLSSIPLKAKIPEWAIAILLSVVSLWGVWTMWTQKATNSSEQPGTIISEKNSARFYLLILLSGLTLGVLTTLTGLGGGVLLMPVLLGIFKLQQDESLATSLFTIALSSAFSLASQYFRGAGDFLSFYQLTLLIIGIVLSLQLLNFLNKKIKAKTLAKFRKTVFTLVVTISLLKFFWPYIQ